MARSIVVVICFVGFVSVASMQSKPDRSGDEAAIEKIADAKLAAYNNHDAKALAEWFAPDADRSSLRGYMSGRTQIEKNYADTFAVDKVAIAKVDSDSLRFLTADVAIQDRKLALKTGVDGSVTALLTDIYVRRNGMWALVAERTSRIQ